MEEFLKYVAVIYGVIQPWLIAFYRKFIRSGKIDIHETSRIEVGFSGTAPTIELNGTLRVLNKDVFVRSMELVITRDKDKAEHVFYWAAFCPPHISSMGIRMSPMEIPAGFLISQNSPHRYNIIFEDSDTSKEIEDLFNKYNAKCSDILAQLNILWPPRAGHDPSQKIKAKQQTLIEDFRNTDAYKDIRNHLASKCYWHHGNYNLLIKVITSKPDKVFSKAFCFTISESDAKKLMLNVPIMVEEPILSYFGTKPIYYFAYTSYNTKESNENQAKTIY